MTKTLKTDTWNGAILAIAGLIYLGLLVLFGYQTWQLVDWLFPNDQLLMKILTLFSFDILAAGWACAHTFYRFRNRGAKTWVQIAWVLTFLLSLIASILYLILESFFRFHVDVSTTTVNIGYGISIFALTLNILALTAFLILEYRASHPRQDYFDSEDDISELSEQDVQTVLQIAKGNGIASRTLHTLIANNGHVKQSRKTSVKT